MKVQKITEFLQFSHFTKPSALKNLQNTANNFLNAGLILPYINMILNGYEPTQKQETDFDKKFITYLKEKEFDTIEEVYKLGFPMNERQYIALNMYPERGYRYNHPTIKKVLKEANENTLYPQALYQYWTCFINYMNSWYVTKHDSLWDKRKAKDIYSTASLIEAFSNIDKKILFKHLSLTQYLDISQKIEKLSQKSLYQRGADSYSSTLSSMQCEWEKLLKSYSDFFKENLSQYNQEINQIINATKTVYLENYVKKEVVKAASTLTFENLPKEVQEKIDTVQDQYKRIYGFKDNLPDSLDRLVKDSLPVYIKDYLSMKEEYRETMTNVQGKTAKILLLESLENISAMLTDFEINQNNEKIKSLSIAARYTKEKL